jgi:hypothetical protein
VLAPEFQLVYRALYRRLRALLEFHADLPGLGSLQDSLEELRQIQGVHRVQWEDWQRTSTRQGRRHSMGGLVGSSLFQGHFRPEWIELLKAGEILHLGKSTTFGMGRYRLSFPLLSRG